MSMLIDILKEIDGANYYSKEKLAQKLDTSEEVIEHLLIQLGGKGYIKEENINIANCSTCSKLNKGCPGALAVNAINTLSITEKGKKLIENRNKH